MERQFWLERWQNNEIGFHEAEANALLLKHISALDLAPANRIFVPLCGKTLDIGWLLAQGYQVVGAELSEAAVQQLFEGLALTPEVQQQADLKLYKAADLMIYVGDIFDLTVAELGRVDAIYDRAALVALPIQMRQRYSQHLVSLTAQAKQLMICYDYDQSQMPGPPFSISDDEVREHYQAHYHCQKLSSAALEGGLKGQCPAIENVWLLSC